MGNSMRTNQSIFDTVNEYLSSLTSFTDIDKMSVPEWCMGMEPLVVRLLCERSKDAKPCLDLMVGMDIKVSARNQDPKTIDQLVDGGWLSFDNLLISEYSNARNKIINGYGAWSNDIIYKSSVFRMIDHYSPILYDIRFIDYIIFLDIMFKERRKRIYKLWGLT